MLSFGGDDRSMLAQVSSRDGQNHTLSLSLIFSPSIDRDGVGGVEVISSTSTPKIKLQIFS